MNPPLMTGAAEFTAAGSELVMDFPAQAIPTKYALQVTGVDAAGAAAAPTSWDVMLIGSLNKTVFNEASKIIEHVNTAQGNGDTLYSAGSFYPARYWKMKCKALVLGATCVKIKVEVLGVK